jgi:hypothetical protein
MGIPPPYTVRVLTISLPIIRVLTIVAWRTLTVELAMPAAR